MIVPDASVANLVATAAAAAVLYTVGLTIWRLYFSPLAGFPGPKIAAATLWYEFYWDVLKKGQWVWEIDRMHRKYGPIVRINPYELHVRDSEFYDELYSGRQEKYSWWTKLAGSDRSTFASVSSEEHRRRRGALNPFFSKRSIMELEPVIREKIGKLCRRLDRFTETGEVVRVDVALMATTIDVICDYGFAADRKYLDEPDFKIEWKNTVAGVCETGAMARHLPWLLAPMQKLPLFVMDLVDPGFRFLTRWHNVTRAQIKPILAYEEEPKLSKGRKTIFHTLRDSDLPAHEKTVERFVDEAATFTIAGSESTAQCTSKIMFFLKYYPEVLEKLRQELRSAFSSLDEEIPNIELQQLPYLTAVVQEGLRLSPIMIRLPRVMQGPMQYKQWVIPAGTPVSETPYFVLMDPEIFPDPTEFRPERWIEAADQGIRLDKYMVIFGKGSRQCAGINLARAEIFQLVATLIMRYDWKFAHNYDLSDAFGGRDAFVMHAKLDDVGFYATLQKRA
ncbi:cytochrome P450 [Xylariaceae sp. FL1651]|nr:cytochrome P450 [Xylariaceae sp. FL1651]